MGHDCSFHLVDERQITDDLVPALLAGGAPPAELRARYEDAAEIWAQVQSSLRDDPPELTAHKICQLAVMLASCRSPHGTARGVALSLWHGPLVPPRGSPEPLFTALIAAHPRLAGHFPVTFGSQFATGVYYAPAHVPGALRWIQGRLAALPAGEREPYAPILRALRAAARSGHGYWEATDLRVVMTRPELLTAGDPRPAGLVVHPEPVFVLPGCVWIFDDAIVVPDQDNQRALHLDLSVFPPRTRPRAGVVPLGVARSRRGRWAILGFDPTSDLRQRGLWLADEFGGPARQIDCDGRRLADDVVFIGERAVLFPDRHAVLADAEAPYPSSTDGGPPRLEDELPAALRTRLGGAPGFVHGSVQLGDGEDVLIWDGHGYERRGSGWERTFAIDLRAVSGVSWTWAPAGDDGFYYLSDRQLFEVHRGSPPVRVLPTVDNIMDVRPGPEGSLILRQGQNKQGHVAKLYFPAELRHAAIAPKDFGLAGSRSLEPVFWSPVAQVMLCLVSEFGAGCELRALSESIALAKRRTRPATTAR